MADQKKATAVAKFTSLPFAETTETETAASIWQMAASSLSSTPGIILSINQWGPHPINTKITNVSSTKKLIVILKAAAVHFTIHSIKYSRALSTVAMHQSTAAAVVGTQPP